MKTIYKIFIFTLLISIYSCEDVIDIPLPDPVPRLVIEASIDWEKNTTGNNQTVLLSKVTPYFSEEKSNPVTDAQVQLRDDNSGEVYQFVHLANGSYGIDNFIPVIDHVYTITVLYQGENYVATETMLEVPDINRIVQSTEGGFDSEAIDISIFFDDPKEEGNHYFFKYKTPKIYCLF